MLLGIHRVSISHGRRFESFPGLKETPSGDPFYLLNTFVTKPGEAECRRDYISNCNFDQKQISTTLVSSPVLGKWRSLVAHLIWDQGAAGSNPVFPTKFSLSQDDKAVVYCSNDYRVQIRQSVERTHETKARQWLWWGLWSLWV